MKPLNEWLNELFSTFTEAHYFISGLAIGFLFGFAWCGVFVIILLWILGRGV